MGPFSIRILVLNLQRESHRNQEQMQKMEIGAGSFGTVSLVKLKNKEYAIKRYPFLRKIDKEGYDYQQQKEEQLQLKRCLKQFCFYKLFSMLGIGPEIVNSGYDIICFNNCIQFKMELCQPITADFNYEVRGTSIDQCKQNLASKLLLMHSLNIVHRDIKP